MSAPKWSGNERALAVLGFLAVLALVALPLLTEARWGQ